jgi:hypothetical protein
MAATIALSSATPVRASMIAWSTRRSSLRVVAISA